MRNTRDAATAATPDPGAPLTAGVRVFIPRSPEAVFDFFADLRNEPRYNGQVSDIRKTSVGPIGLGTTFEGSHVGLGQVSWRLAEYERPRRVVIEGGVGQGSYRWTSDLSAAAGGTWLQGTMEWQPPRGWRMFRRLLEAILQVNARRSFGRMAKLLAGD